MIALSTAGPEMHPTGQKNLVAVGTMDSPRAQTSMPISMKCQPMELTAKDGIVGRRRLRIKLTFCSPSSPNY